jgi:hypothetical protein
MKRLLAGIGTTALLAGGVVTGATTTAQADPYPGTVKTFCHVDVKGNKVGSKTRVVVRVTAAGSGDPRGRVNVSAERRSGGDGAGASDFYDGGRLTLSLGKLSKGNYEGSLHFNSKPARSVYKNCSNDFSFRVTRR